MITAQEARQLVASKEEVAQKIAELHDLVTESATSGLLFLEYSIQDLVLAQQLLVIVTELGYSARIDSNRHLLILKWE